MMQYESPKVLHTLSMYKEKTCWPTLGVFLYLSTKHITFVLV